MSYSVKLETPQLEVEDVVIEEAHAIPLGFYNYPVQTITINPDQSLDAMKSTLFHEVMHAVWWDAGLSTEDEEVYVNVIANRLVDTLQRNPKLVEFIMGRRFIGARQTKH